MKKYYTIIILVISFLCPLLASGAENFYKLPVIEGRETLRTDQRLEVKTDKSHDETLAFYREILKDYEDVKYRDWKDATYIEDDSNRGWHSITISKMDKDGAEVVFIKDNWTWIIGTLILRYVGVFVVLLVLYCSMTISGTIIDRTIGKIEKSKK